ncbi:uncharacterized protein [Clytia hemisphaerica]|uniref:BTB domain-containing protein n=1 Tax=Clytia hemisphaerica TaxID=252671 RepID=A0A7M5VER9_9CNID
MKRTLFEHGTGNEKKSKIEDEQQEEELIFSKPWKGSDGVVIVEDKELHVHTTVLSLASPVFEKMFNGGFKEAQTRRVTLEGKSYDLVEHMLKLIYPNDLSSLDPEPMLCPNCLVKKKQNRNLCRWNIARVKDTPEITLGQRLYTKHLQKLYQIANEYMVKRIIELVKNEIDRQCRSLYDLFNAFDILESSELLDLKNIKEDCFKFISEYKFGVNPYTVQIIESKLQEREISLESNLRIKGILLQRFVESDSPASKGEIKKIAKGLASFDINKYGTPSQK